MQEISKSILFWTKYITSYASKEKLSQEYSIILIGNKGDKIADEKKSQVIELLNKFIGVAVSSTCIISGIPNCLVNVYSAKEGLVINLRRLLAEQAKNIFHEHNSFFQVPKIYSEVDKELRTLKSSTNKIFLHTSEISIPEVNDTCYIFLQDMGLVLFNRNTQVLCLDPQLLAKAFACFVMPPEHEHIVYGLISEELRKLSIIPQKLIEKRLIKANVASKLNIAQVIECLQQFDFCCKLIPEERKFYQIESEDELFLFPFMRPKSPSFTVEMPNQQVPIFTLACVVLESRGNSIGSNFFFRFQVNARQKK